MGSDLNWIDEHPISKVVWVPVDSVRANDYNPNSVAPKEMQLLRLSIESDALNTESTAAAWKVKTARREQEVIHIGIGSNARSRKS